MKISVVTVCFNSQKTINRTIKSVAEQNNCNFEYIIVDGASSDGTIDIINSWQNKIPLVLISEPDKGIYDAMNKGVKLAKGDWILFLNSDDCFYSKDSLSQIELELKDNVDIVYGATEFAYDGFSVIRVPRPLPSFWKKMPFNHQSSLSRRNLLLQHPFDLKYRLAADYEFFLYAYKNGYSFREIDKIISVFYSGGVSTKYQYQAIKEYSHILKKYGYIGLRIFIYYQLLFLKPFFKRISSRKIKRIVYKYFVH